MNLVIRKIGRCPPFSHMGDLLNTCMLWIGLFECHILLENPVEFRYEPEPEWRSEFWSEPEFWLSFRFRFTESEIFRNTTPVPFQPECDYQHIWYPSRYSGSVLSLPLTADWGCYKISLSKYLAIFAHGRGFPFKIRGSGSKRSSFHEKIIPFFLLSYS